jgi:hypothetical protein
MRHDVILIAKRVYHAHRTFIGSGLLDRPAKGGRDVILESSCLDA